MIINGDSVWEGGFCPICNIYWGDSVLVNKKEGGGDSVRGGLRFCPTLMENMCNNYNFHTASAKMNAQKAAFIKLFEL